MNQINLIEDAPAAVNPSAAQIESGGYSPDGKAIYRGRQVPVTYTHHHGMSVLQLPVLFWLMDLVIEELQAGPVHWLDLLKTGFPVDPDTLSKHLGLLEHIGLIVAEPVFFGSRSPAEGNYRGFHNQYLLAAGQAEAA